MYTKSVSFKKIMPR